MAISAENSAFESAFESVLGAVLRRLKGLGLAVAGFWAEPRVGLLWKGNASPTRPCTDRFLRIRETYRLPPRVPADFQPIVST